MHLKRCFFVIIKEMEKLILNLIKEGTLKTKSVIEAFRNIDRKDFVLSEYKEDAYKDIPLPIGYGQTISQPTTVAFMLELLQVKKGDRVLDVGSGSGWTTALLSYLAKDGFVWGVEILPELVLFGKSNLSKYNFKNSIILEAKEEIGLREKGPFDKILVSASAETVPFLLLEQLKEGGIMVIPIRDSIWKIKKINGKIETEVFEGFLFVPLID